MSPTPRVAVLTLNWNAAAQTARWLESLATVAYPRDRLCAIIRDNASTDDSVERLRALMEQRSADLPPTMLVRGVDHPGVTAAFNEILARLPGDVDYVFRVDNDVRLSPEALPELVRTLQADTGIGVAAPKLLRTAPRDGIDGGAIFVNWWGGPNRISTPDAVTTCDVVLGAVMAFPLRVLNRLSHWFRPDFYLFAEEPDVCARVRGLGLRTVYVPTAVAYHETGSGTGRHPWLSAYLHARNHVRLHAEYGPRAAYVPYLVRTAAAVAWRALSRGEGGEIRGLIDGLLSRAVPRSLWDREIARAQRKRRDST
ncbi:MAG: glycosyltransferase [Planctomycetales bacterium]|nr:glycosyltransferase [Planctomycetales bacterium]